MGKLGAARRLNPCDLVAAVGCRRTTPVSACEQAGKTDATRTSRSGIRQMTEFVKNRPFLAFPAQHEAGQRLMALDCQSPARRRRFGAGNGPQFHAILPRPRPNKNTSLHAAAGALQRCGRGDTRQQRDGILVFRHFSVLLKGRRRVAVAWCPVAGGSVRTPDMPAMTGKRKIGNRGWVGPRPDPDSLLRWLPLVWI